MSSTVFTEVIIRYYVRQTMNVGALIENAVHLLKERYPGIVVLASPAVDYKKNVTDTDAKNLAKSGFMIESSDVNSIIIRSKTITLFTEDDVDISNIPGVVSVRKISETFLNVEAH